ncbi:MAG: sulfatase-like hydrolase/transferase, partial [Candidatus Cryptobacteroides sp.]
LAHSYYPVELWENGKRIRTGNDLVVQGCRLPDSLDRYDAASYEQYGGKHYSCDLMYDKMEKFIEDNASSPFFVMWTTTVPHSAVQAPMDEVMYYVDKLGDEEPCTEPGMYLPNRYPHATYAAMVTHIDKQVGRLVSKLKELGVWENTIFIVSSDNGPAHNGNSPMEYFNSGGPFRCCAGWGKSSLREGGTRMPFIVCRGGSKQGRTVSRISSFADIMPTLAEVAGIEAPENDGVSFAPVLYGKEAAEHEALYWEFPGGKGWVAVRTGEWKGLLRNVRSGNAVMELYNLQDDPQETTDLASEHPEIVEKIWEVVRTSHTDANPEVEKFQLDIPEPKSFE